MTNGIAPDDEYIVTAPSAASRMGTVISLSKAAIEAIENSAAFRDCVKKGGDRYTCLLEVYMGYLSTPRIPIDIPSPSTLEFRKSLVSNPSIMEELSSAIDNVLKKYKISVDKENTYVFVPHVVEKPETIMELANLFDTRKNTNILEPAYMEATRALRLRR